MLRYLLYHPHGNENVRHLLQTLVTDGRLSRFFTSIAVFTGTLLFRMGKIPGLHFLLRRRYADNLHCHTTSFPFITLLFRLPKLQRLFIKKEQDLNGFLQQRIARRMKRKSYDYDVVYCYPNGAADIFHEAKTQGKICVYEYPIAYYDEIRRIQKEEQQHSKHWRDTKIMYKTESSRQMIDKELELADIIIVPSQYIRGTLLAGGCPMEKVHVVPYGFANVKPKQYTPVADRKLQVLFVGGLYWLKGATYLIEAMNQLSAKIHLTLIGTGPDSEALQAMTEGDSCTFLGSVGHDEVLRQMQSNDILILPSLSDGCPLVTLEAMSVGTPVVLTDKCGSMQWIEHGRNGWIIPSRSTQAIVDVLSDIAAHPSQIETVGREAQNVAAQWSWDDYGKAVTSLVSKNAVKNT